MIIEKFTQNILNSGLFRLYIASGFFGTVVFFVLNSNLFTPLEMTVGIIIVTIALKGISNLMLSMIILFFSLDNKKEEMDFKYNTRKIESLLNELSLNENSTNAAK